MYILLLLLFYLYIVIIDGLVSIDIKAISDSCKELTSGDDYISIEIYSYDKDNDREKLLYKTNTWNVIDNNNEYDDIYSIYIYNNIFNRI